MTSADLIRLDGQRVTLEGVYTPRFIAKRPGRAPEGVTPRTVAIDTGDLSIQLGVYYRAEGVRAAEEIEKWAGKRVRVVGVLHARTPTMTTPEGIPMATMIGPYLGAIEEISGD